MGQNIAKWGKIWLNVATWAKWGKFREKKRSQEEGKIEGNGKLKRSKLYHHRWLLQVNVRHKLKLVLVCINSRNFSTQKHYKK